jgi:hypothetical protein
MGERREKRRVQREASAARENVVDYDDADDDNHDDAPPDDVDGVVSAVTSADTYDDDIDDVFASTGGSAHAHGKSAQPAPLRAHTHDDGTSATRATLVPSDVTESAVVGAGGDWLLLVEPGGAVTIHAVERAPATDAVVVTPMARSTLLSPQRATSGVVSEARAGVCVRGVNKPLPRDGAPEMVNVPYAIVVAVVHDVGSMHTQQLYLEVRPGCILISRLVCARARSGAASSTCHCAAGVDRRRNESCCDR